MNERRELQELEPFDEFCVAQARFPSAAPVCAPFCQLFVNEQNH